MPKGLREEEKHTPTPWHVAGYGILGPKAVLSDQICVTMNSRPVEERKANVDFIVRAVNAHDELLSALIELLTAHTILFPSEEAGKEAQDAWADRREKARETAYAAIAKAESSPVPGGRG